MIYGGPRDNNITKLVNQLKKYSIFPIFGNGKNLIQPVFVWDLVDVIVHSLEHPETSGKEYTVAGKEALTYHKALEIIAENLGKRVRFIHVPISLCYILAKIYQMLVKHPRVTAEQIMRFGEDKNFDIEIAGKELDYHPLSFIEGVKLKIKGDV